VTSGEAPRIVRDTRLVAGSEIPPPPEKASSVPLPGLGVADVRDPLPAEIRDPTFSFAMRGYDRHDVDRYVEQVNRLIAELQVSGSPRSAVRHALERVGEQTSGILQRARETAEEIIASARQEAEETTQRAKAEAGDILEDAGQRMGQESARASAAAEEIVAAARTRADETLRQAAEQAEQTLAGARADAEAQRLRARQEIDKAHEQALARMAALESDIARVADARRTALAGVEQIAARLAQVLADAAEQPIDGEKRAADEPGGAP
jgi:DivIVA domain-containing protein